jgi:RHS repeat-associated protein
MDDRDRPVRPRNAAAQPGAGGRDWSAGRMAAPSATVPDSPVPGGGPSGADFRFPAISLPPGGGAIRGIDEKLTVSQATGTAALSVGVFTSPARQGSGPQLGLSYDSGSGNGPYGAGWSLPVPSITRKTSTGLPRYDDGAGSDVFVLSGAEDLVPLLTPSGPDWVPDSSVVTLGASTFAVTAYRPRVEGGFARIERWQETGTGATHWRTVSRDNVTSLFGQDQSSQIADPAEPSRVFSWLLDLSFDDRGNAISYQYKPEDAVGVPQSAGELGRQTGANRYLKRIYYGNDTPYRPAAGGGLPAQWCFQVVFDYGEHAPANPLPAESAAWPCRPDPFSTYRPGFEVRTHRTCRRILMFHQLAELGPDPVLVRSTDLAYSTGSADAARPAYTMLAAVTQTGWVRLADGSGYDTAQLPPLQLGYSALVIDGTQQVPGPPSTENFTAAFGGGDERWIDLDGEGLPGILSEDDGAWYYQHNVSAWNPAGPATARFEPAALVAAKPATSTPDGAMTLTDLNGDGNLCAVSFTPPDAGWYERAGDGAWAPFRSLAATANIDWQSPNLRFVDLDGDGLADVLITDDDALTWYQWEAGTGFAPAGRVPKPFDENRGPALVLADPTGSVFLADISGDGLADLVRIRNGEVCYWPNLGYGRFAAKVMMDGAPVFDTPDRFDPRRIRLADIDGSGTADLIYLGSGTVTIWFNQSGTGWTTGTALPQFPAADDIAEVTAFDLLGAGTACLVWTSDLPAQTAQPLRYIDLTGGVKPYLLTSVANNLGARKSLSYAPSTKFYLQDRAAGNPWVTRLPFPVHVVERVQTDDAVSRTTLVSTYTYHHGFYDGVEREFRGFARVDQLDSDTIPAASGTGVFTTTPPVAGGDFAPPPAWTRTWYHTGAYFGRTNIAGHLASEYYQLDPQAPHLGDTVLPAGTSAEDLREACRALRGRVLRQEVYALDGSAAAVHPYSTSEHRYQVRPLQPSVPGCYGGFYAWELEALACHYERDPADPRISHQLTLEVDDYGSPTRTAAVGYPRRAPAFPQQAVTFLSYTESDVINMADQPGWYRIGLPAETRSYELTGIAPGAARYDPGDLLTAAAAAADIPYEATPDETTPQRRLIARARTIYRTDDLSAALPAGQADTLALVSATYHLTYTPGLIAGIYGARISAADLAGQGGYADLDGDGGQWSSTLRPFYSPDPASPDPAYAQQHFYLACGATDPWGNVARVSYDAHDLLVIQASDAADNVTLASVNYRVLQPWLRTDPNANRSGVRYDALGMVVATASLGKLLPDGTDEGDHLDTSTDEPAAGDDPTARLSYDLPAFQAWAADPGHDPDHPQPAWVRTQSRVRHKDPATPWLETYAYSDGFGRVALAKSQAEAGLAPQRDSSGRLVTDARGNLVFQPTSARWVGTGRVVYDNKANPVKAYEPFFDSSPGYDDETDLVDWGVTAITGYDPLSRVIRVDNPDGTFRTTETGAWATSVSDENDTVLASRWYAVRQGAAPGSADADAAAKAAADAATPARADLDPLGRVFRTVADNGPGGQYATVLRLDIQGNTRTVTDPLGREVLTRDYNLAGTEIHHVSADSGEHWLATDAAGQPLAAWDARPVRARYGYDMLRRPVTVHVTRGTAPERLAEQVTYGEGLADAPARNLRGAVYQTQDEAGVSTNAQRDFDGNVLSASRQLLTDYSGDVDWAQAPPVNAETFGTAWTYDALRRPVTITTPEASVTRPVYNERSLLAQVAVSPGGAASATNPVSSVSYDAKGQRQVISYGNGAVTSYAYDPDTFRLIRLQTSRPTAGGPLQDLSYAYDPVGNVTRVTDAAQQAVFFANQVVPARADYTYDAVYRLTRAAGREHIGQVGQDETSWDDSDRISVPLPADGQAMRNYAETYAYDPAGNLTSTAHAAAGGSWTRTYAYTPGGNRLATTTVGASSSGYTYDASGDMTSMPQLPVMTWDWKNQLQATAVQAPADGVAPTTYYQYNSAGARVRKATASPAGALTAERTYLGGYEVYREYSPAGTVTLERQSLVIPDGAALVCLLETTTTDAAAAPGTLPATVSRYQLGDLLGSAVLELDASAAILTYEEYYPYGSTSFQTGRSAAEVSTKRYRYTAKERDPETGLYYHGARYYAPWLGRWTSPDPAGFVDGPNLYAYCRDNPVNMHDPSGTQGTPGQASSDDGPSFHLEPTHPDPSGRPAPGLRLVFDRPKFAPLRWVMPDPPPDKSATPAAAAPAADPAEPQPINPLQYFGPGPTSDPLRANIAGTLGYSSVGAGALSLGYAAALGLYHKGTIAVEGVANIGGTGGTDGSLTSGAASVGGHVTYNPDGSRNNWTGYVLGTQTWGQNPPGTGATNAGGATTVGYEHHFGGTTNQSPFLVLGGNLGAGLGQYAGITPASPPAGSPAQTGYLSPAVSASAVINAALNFDYYTATSQIPRLTLFGEGFASLATGTSRFELPDGGLSLGGHTVAGGANVGGLYNFRLDEGRSVISVGATLGPRWESDTVGSRTSHASGVFFGLVGGAAF